MCLAGVSLMEAAGQDGQESLFLPSSLYFLCLGGSRSTSNKLQAACLVQGRKYQAAGIHESFLQAGSKFLEGRIARPGANSPWWGMIVFNRSPNGSNSKHWRPTPFPWPGKHQSLCQPSLTEQHQTAVQASCSSEYLQATRLQLQWPRISPRIPVPLEKVTVLEVTSCLDLSLPQT